MPKICVINIQGEEISGLFTYYAKEVGAKVLRPETKLDTKSPDPGVKRAFALSSSYVTLLNKREMIEQIIEAEKEGYDAVVLHCFLDPGLRKHNHKLIASKARHPVNLEPNRFVNSVRKSF